MNVPLPRIPTDNIYKFAAILGSILFVIGILMLPIIRISIESRITKTRAVSRIDSVNRSVRQAKMEYFESYTELSNTIQDVKYKLEIKRKGSDTLKMKMDKAEKWNENTLKKLLFYDSLMQSTPLKVDQIPFYYSSYALNFLFVISIIFSIGGFMLGSFGFINWYEKLQKPMDQWYANLPKTIDKNRHLPDNDF